MICGIPNEKTKHKKNFTRPTKKREKDVHKKGERKKGKRMFIEKEDSPQKCKSFSPQNERLSGNKKEREKERGEKRKRKMLTPPEKPPRKHENH